jgi:hypothetical protein
MASAIAERSRSLPLFEASIQRRLDRFGKLLGFTETFKKTFTQELTHPSWERVYGLEPEELPANPLLARVLCALARAHQENTPQVIYRQARTGEQKSNFSVTSIVAGPESSLLFKEWADKAERGQLYPTEAFLLANLQTRQAGLEPEEINRATVNALLKTFRSLSINGNEPASPKEIFQASLALTGDIVRLTGAFLTGQRADTRSWLEQSWPESPSWDY